MPQRIPPIELTAVALQSPYGDPWSDADLLGKETNVLFRLKVREPVFVHERDQHLSCEIVGFTLDGCRLIADLVNETPMFAVKKNVARFVKEGEPKMVVSLVAEAVDCPIVSHCRARVARFENQTPWLDK